MHDLCIVSFSILLFLCCVCFPNSLTWLDIYADIEPLQTNPDLEEGYCTAVLCRLRFRKVLPCVFFHMLLVFMITLNVHLLEEPNIIPDDKVI